MFGVHKRGHAPQLLGFGNDLQRQGCFPGRLRSEDFDDPATRDAADFGIIEAVIGEASGLIGATAQELTLFDRTGLNLLAISRRDQRFTERLGQIRFQNGDVILLQGHIKRLPELLREWDCLPLVERGLRLGSVRNSIVPLAILLSTLAVFAARPIGTRIQQRITTTGDPGNLRVLSIRPSRRGEVTAHRVETHSS